MRIFAKPGELGHAVGRRMLRTGEVGESMCLEVGRDVEVIVLRRAGGGFQVMVGFCPLSRSFAIGLRHALLTCEEGCWIEAIWDGEGGHWTTGLCGEPCFVEE